MFECKGCGLHFESKRGVSMHQINSDDCSTDDGVSGTAKSSDLWEKMGADYADQAAGSVYQHHQALK